LGLLSTNKDFKSQLAEKAPHEINAGCERELADMGVWEPVRRNFCRERNYTTTQRLHFMQRLRSLAGVEGRNAFVYRATTAANESEGLSMLHELEVIFRSPPAVPCGAN
jgi:hypothetical protein